MKNWVDILVLIELLTQLLDHLDIEYIAIKRKK